MRMASGGEGDCVEVARLPEAVLVRESKDPSGPMLSFSRDQWAAFLSDVKAGGHDPRP